MCIFLYFLTFYHASLLLQLTKKIYLGTEASQYFEGLNPHSSKKYVVAWTRKKHRMELTILPYHKVMVIYPYRFSG